MRQKLICNLFFEMDRNKKGSHFIGGHIVSIPAFKNMG